MNVSNAVAEDFIMVEDIEEILKCKTFFVIVRNNGN